MPLHLCDHCTKPGLCCREIHIYSGENARTLGGAETKLEALVWLATVYHFDDWMSHIGLPFLPEQREENGDWVLSCPHLTVEGRCGDYENRPRLCRTYEPGLDAPCVFTTAESRRAWYDPDDPCIKGKGEIIQDLDTPP